MAGTTRGSGLDKVVICHPPRENSFSRRTADLTVSRSLISSPVSWVLTYSSSARAGKSLTQAV